MKFKYNYIVAGGGNYYEVAYYDLRKLANVIYYKSYVDGISGNLRQLLCRLNFNITLNKYIKTPLQSIVYPWLFPHHFSEEKPLCFVFFESYFAVINTSYLDYLRRTYPTVKLVLYMQDIVSSLKYYDIDRYKQYFDVILTYDQGDAIKYDLRYHPTPYSLYPVECHKQEDIDVYFCGAGKNRYQAILEVYNKCVKLGLKCKFFITGVPEHDKIVGDGLMYDQQISYIENLEYVVSSKCILEVMQEQADGFSLRLWEAMMYDKHLLTNNKSVEHSEYWNPQAIHLLSDLDSIKSYIYNPISFSMDMKSRKSPISLLSYIDQII